MINIDTVVYFRVDASSMIGLGHLYRCTVIANTAKMHGFKVHFICRENTTYDYNLLKKMELDFTLLSSSEHNQITDEIGRKEVYSGWLGATSREDSRQVIDIIKSSNVKHKVIISDHYGTDKEWDDLVVVYCDVLVKLSDRPITKTSADIVLDQTLERDRSEYNKVTANDCEVLAGTKYSLINPAFLKLRDEAIKRRRNNNVLQNVLVSFGGSDPLNLTKRFFEHLANYPQPISYDVVCGSCNPHLLEIQETIDKLTENNYNISLHIDTSEMPKLMLNADIAVGAAGSACWERAILGLPSIIVAFENNQIDISSSLKDKRAALTVELEHFESDITESMALLCNDLDLRKEISINSSLLCDGHGAERLITRLKELINDKI